jgi:amidophosphoribosyltransferase
MVTAQAASGQAAAAVFNSLSRGTDRMSETLAHECAVAAVYWLNKAEGAPIPGEQKLAGKPSTLIPGMLLDLQNRGQLAAGFSTYSTERAQLLDTFKYVGSVTEAFQMTRPDRYETVMSEYAGNAAIGHTRYATSGADDARYAQPFERHHGRRWKWFSFAFNGTLANNAQLRNRLLSKRGYHFSLNTDTETIMHAIAHRLRGNRMPSMEKVMSDLATDFDGAYNIVFLDAMGRMFVARDPLGIRPVSWARQGNLFAAASESVALANLGFTDIQSLDPGEMAIIEDGELRFVRYAPACNSARCFFEWVYFANVASEIDGAGVYQSRVAAGTKLAEMEDQLIDDDCVVVPVPDTAKAAADAFAYAKRIPCMEGIIRNRYVGRTFIQPAATRSRSANRKYTPLPSVLGGKRVFLMEDSIVRSTTLRRLVRLVRDRGEAAEVHVRVACPPIIAPCFYGIDMSTVAELFAPAHKQPGYRGTPSQRMLKRMAADLEVDSLRYLPVEELPTAIGYPAEDLCLGCVIGKYPTRWGNRLHRLAKHNEKHGVEGRTND